MQLTCLITTHHHISWSPIPQIQLNIKGVSVAPHFTLKTENANNTLGTSKLKLQISLTSNKMALEHKQAMTEKLNEGADKKQLTYSNLSFCSYFYSLYANLFFTMVSAESTLPLLHITFANKQLIPTHMMKTCYWHKKYNPWTLSTALPFCWCFQLFLWVFHHLLLFLNPKMLMAIYCEGCSMPTHAPKSRWWLQANF